MPLIAVAGFQHETNTFAGSRAEYYEFEMKDAWPALVTGHGVIEAMRGVNLPAAGFIDAAAGDPAIEIAPVLWCSAEPSGPVSDEAYERITAMILDGIAAAGPVDGIYLDLHGAMVTESLEDGEGELLGRIRARFGDTIPVAVSLDMHANVTPAMVDRATSLSIFRTYPHLDMATTGGRAFSMMRRHLAGDKPAKAFRQSPFLLPLPAQFTGAGACAGLYARLPGPEAEAAADIALGFPAADVHDAGPSIVAYGKTQAEADALADALLAALVAAEPDFDPALLTPEDAVRSAMASTAEKPVIIADVQDNPGAGASSDTTGLLAALVALGARGAVLGVLDDAAAADAAHVAGEGAEITLALGGRSGVEGDGPFAGRFRVETLTDGRFPFTGEMYGGSVAELGPTAVLRVLDTEADLRVVVGSIRSQCLDRAIFTHAGIDPAGCRIVAVKSTVHFRADFEPIGSAVLNVAAPGENPCQLENLPYRRLRKGVRLGPGARSHG